MISANHRNKLIDGIVVAMGAPKGMRPKYGAGAESKTETPDEPEGDEGGKPKPSGDSTEGTDFARDALAVIREWGQSYYDGPGDNTDPAVARLRSKRKDDLAAAFREAIWGIMRSYKDE